MRFTLFLQSCPTKFFFFENLEKSRVATEYIHATPTLRPAYFHFAVYVELPYQVFFFTRTSKKYYPKACYHNHIHFFLGKTYTHNGFYST